MKKKIGYLNILLAKKTTLSLVQSAGRTSLLESLILAPPVLTLPPMTEVLIRLFDMNSNLNKKTFKIARKTKLSIMLSLKRASVL